MFQRAGWFDFFQRINGFNLEVSYQFAQGFDKDTVLFDTVKFELTRELITEATCIAGDGEIWFKKIPFTFNPKDFLLPEVKTMYWGKGVQLDKFNPEWREAIGILQSYITCEGIFSLVFKYHVRFLLHLNQQFRMNLPFLLLKILQKMSNKIKGHRYHTHQYVFHHGLIKLIVCIVLQKKSRTWDHFFVLVRFP